MKEDSDMGAHACEGRIDELLNSFIDGELTAREQTEVERLRTNDVRIAQRLQELEKCKMLVGSLPRAEAPSRILEGVKASLAGTSIAPPVEEPAYDQRAGRIHLLGRKLLSAAAMIGLLAVLAGVIYTIMAPQTASEGPRVVVDHQPPVNAEVVRPGPGAADTLAFSGKLELRTDVPTEVGTIINTSIKENGLSDSIGDVREQDKRIHYVRCSREALNSLLADLEDIWPRLDSATMFIDTKVFGRQVEVDAVTTGQIVEIIDQDSSERRIALARDFGLLNSMAENLPGGEILSAIEGEGPGLMIIPKPILVSSRNAKKPADEAEDKKTVRLTIIVSR